MLPKLMEAHWPLVPNGYSISAVANANRFTRGGTSALASLKIYRRKGKLFIVETDGVIDLSPVVEVADHEQFAATLSDILSKPQIFPEEVPNLRDYKSPLLAAVGVRRWSELERGLQMVSVAQTPEGIVAQKYVPEPSWRSGLAPGDVILKQRESDPVELADKLLAALEDPNWPVR